MKEREFYRQRWFGEGPKTTIAELPIWNWLKEDAVAIRRFRNEGWVFTTLLRKMSENKDFSFLSHKASVIIENFFPTDSYMMATKKCKLLCDLEVYKIESQILEIENFLDAQPAPRDLSELGESIKKTYDVRFKKKIPLKHSRRYITNFLQGVSGLPLDKNLTFFENDSQLSTSQLNAKIEKNLLSYQRYLDLHLLAMEEDEEMVFTREMMRSFEVIRNVVPLCNHRIFEKFKDSALMKRQIDSGTFGVNETGHEVHNFSKWMNLYGDGDKDVAAEEGIVLAWEKGKKETQLQDFFKGFEKKSIDLTKVEYARELIFNNNNTRFNNEPFNTTRLLAVKYIADKSVEKDWRIEKKHRQSDVSNDETSEDKITMKEMEALQSNQCIYDTDDKTRWDVSFEKLTEQLKQDRDSEYLQSVHQKLVDLKSKGSMKMPPVNYGAIYAVIEEAFDTNSCSNGIYERLYDAAVVYRGVRLNLYGKVCKTVHDFYKKERLSQLQAEVIPQLRDKLERYKGCIDWKDGSKVHRELIEREVIQILVKRYEGSLPKALLVMNAIRKIDRNFWSSWVENYCSKSCADSEDPLKNLSECSLQDQKEDKLNDQENSNFNAIDYFMEQDGRKILSKINSPIDVPFQHVEAELIDILMQNNGQLGLLEGAHLQSFGANQTPVISTVVNLWQSWRLSSDRGKQRLADFVERGYYRAAEVLVKRDRSLLNDFEERWVVQMEKKEALLWLKVIGSVDLSSFEEVIDAMNLGHLRSEKYQTAETNEVQSIFNGQKTVFIALSSKDDNDKKILALKLRKELLRKEYTKSTQRVFAELRMLKINVQKDICNYIQQEIGGLDKAQVAVFTTKPERDELIKLGIFKDAEEIRSCKHIKIERRDMFEDSETRQLMQLGHLNLDLNNDSHIQLLECWVKVMKGRFVSEDQLEKMINNTTERLEQINKALCTEMVNNACQASLSHYSKRDKLKLLVSFLGDARNLLKPVAIIDGDILQNLMDDIEGEAQAFSPLLLLLAEGSLRLNPENIAKLTNMVETDFSLCVSGFNQKETDINNNIKSMLKQFTDFERNTQIKEQTCKALYTFFVTLQKKGFKLSREIFRKFYRGTLVLSVLENTDTDLSDLLNRDIFREKISRNDRMEALLFLFEQRRCSELFANDRLQKLFLDLVKQVEPIHKQIVNLYCSAVESKENTCFLIINCDDWKDKTQSKEFFCAVLSRLLYDTVLSKKDILKAHFNYQIACYGSEFLSETTSKMSVNTVKKLLEIGCTLDRRWSPVPLIDGVYGETETKREIKKKIRTLLLRHSIKIGDQLTVGKLKHWVEKDDLRLAIEMKQTQIAKNLHLEYSSRNDMRIEDEDHRFFSGKFTEQFRKSAHTTTEGDEFSKDKEPPK